mmetsp:Transcript_20005/g.51933  ORF Transcript_20005/g.51933 Transcript_20005/m.51933 type:complete len:243 (-) Transcript_20005:1065-1793(-)
MALRVGEFVAFRFERRQREARFVTLATTAIPVLVKINQLLLVDVASWAKSGAVVQHSIVDDLEDVADEERPTAILTTFLYIEDVVRRGLQEGHVAVEDVLWDVTFMEHPRAPTVVHHVLILAVVDDVCNIDAVGKCWFMTRHWTLQMICKISPPLGEARTINLVRVGNHHVVKHRVRQPEVCCRHRKRPHLGDKIVVGQLGCWHGEVRPGRHKFLKIIPVHHVRWPQRVVVPALSLVHFSAR